MEDKSGISKAGFVRNNFLQNDMMTLQTSTGNKSGRALGSLTGVIDLETAPYKRF